MHRMHHRVVALVGAAAVIAGVALLAVVVVTFAVTRGDGGGAAPARSGALAMQLDPVTEHPREVPVVLARRPARPARIAIPSIGVDAPVVPLGLNPDRTLEVPTDFGDAGWWTGGARPGERGPAVIAGHVDSHTGPAVFFRIGELRPGAAIVVARRDGTRARFTVVSSERYPKARFPTKRVYGATRGPTLRLITCSGVFDRASGHYLDNTVVYAVSA